jgi:hypothetical protein
MHDPHTDRDQLPLPPVPTSYDGQALDVLALRWRPREGHVGWRIAGTVAVESHTPPGATWLEIRGRELARQCPDLEYDVTRVRLA